VVASLGDDLRELQQQLCRGSLQRAYGSILDYMAQLRLHFARIHGERAVSALYQGRFDMTYFALFPPALRSRGLKLAVVFDYTSFAFEIWLAARNRPLQRRYRRLLSDNGWSKHRLVEPAVGIDAIVRVEVTDALALEETEALTVRIEAAAQALLDDLGCFLDTHDPPQAASRPGSL